MAQKSDCDNSIDNTDNSPRPRRVRNNLTLEKKVAVIEAYDRRLNYTQMARMFKCSVYQIKNIIAKRDVIMECHNVTFNEKVYDLEETDDMKLDLKETRIEYLGECVYESIKRLNYHTKQPVTEDLIRLKALEFQDILKIRDFTPNKNWLDTFVTYYNISLAKKQIVLHKAPALSLECKDIMAHCAKKMIQKINNCLQSDNNKCTTNSAKDETKRMFNLLQHALSEYMYRVGFHHKYLQLTNIMMHKIAIEFNEILKVRDFQPTLEWVHTFMKYFDDSQFKLEIIKKPRSSLDLRDILSYCSLAPKEMSIITKFPETDTSSDSDLKFQQNSLIYLDHDDDEDDIKPSIEVIEVEQSQLQEAPPLKAFKIESINNDLEMRRNFTKSKETSLISITEDLQKSYIIPDEPYEDNTVHIDASVSAANIQIEEEIVRENEFILPHVCNTPTLTTKPTIVKQETIATATIDSETAVHIPGHVNSFKDILLLLKPLEEYAMLKENYRAISLITQLEEVFKNQLVEEKELIE